MGILDKLFGPGAVAAPLTEAAKTAADIVERWAPGDEKRHQMQQEVDALVAKARAEARSYDPRTLGNLPFTEVWNAVIDGINRLIRPAVAIGLLGGLFGWWPIAIHTVDPIIVTWSEAVFGFYFGVRTLTADLPRLLKELRK